jgi:hypothetical protein
MGWFNLLVCPHYDSEPYRQPALKAMMKRTPLTASIALDEHAALEIVDNAYRVHLFKSGAKARKCYWIDGKFVVKQLSQSVTYRPLVDLLDF